MPCPSAPTAQHHCRAINPARGGKDELLVFKTKKLERSIFLVFGY